ncbi:hypothetical protein AAY473_032783 [Plecturocebus cupreus]
MGKLCFEARNSECRDVLTVHRCHACLASHTSRMQTLAFLTVEVGFPHIGQVSLELLTSGDLPPLPPEVLGLQAWSLTLLLSLESSDVISVHYNLHLLGSTAEMFEGVDLDDFFLLLKKEAQRVPWGSEEASGQGPSCVGAVALAGLLLATLPPAAFPGLRDLVVLEMDVFRQRFVRGNDAGNPLIRNGCFVLRWPLLCVFLLVGNNPPPRVLLPRLRLDENREGTLTRPWKAQRTERWEQGRQRWPGATFPSLAS